MLNSFFIFPDLSLPLPLPFGSNSSLGFLLFLFLRPSSLSSALIVLPLPTSGPAIVQVILGRSEVDSIVFNGPYSWCWWWVGFGGCESWVEDMQQWWAVVGLVGQAVGCREFGFGWVRDFWLIWIAGLWYGGGRRWCGCWFCGGGFLGRSGFSGSRSATATASACVVIVNKGHNNLCTTTFEMGLQFASSSEHPVDPCKRDGWRLKGESEFSVVDVGRWDEINI